MSVFRHPLIVIVLLVTLAGCPACGSVHPQQITHTLSPSPSHTASRTPLPSATPTASPSATHSATPTPYPRFDPAGCLRPPDDYSLVTVNGWRLNSRTFAMLQHAAAMYSGEIDLTDRSITQGSFRENQGSFGTHLGGGAVDISVMRPGTYQVLWDDVPAVLRAMRAAGFAAWLREYGELCPDSSIHIHAIAVGDEELSQPARDQLTGAAGYFRGYSGIPETIAPLAPDRYGGPILCAWMLDLGYADLREETPAQVTPFPTLAAETRGQHIVLPGETIASIASLYGVSIAAIATSNQLEHFEQLPVGLALTIPQP